MKFFHAILFFIATLLIYWGVPPLSWGLGDLTADFSSTPRLGNALIVVLFSLAVGVQAYGSIQGIRGGKSEESKFVFCQRLVRIMLVLSLYRADVTIQEGHHLITNSLYHDICHPRVLSHISINQQISG